MEESVPEQGEVSILVDRRPRENSRSAILTTLAWLRDLKKTIGIAPSLSAVGVRKDAIPRLVEIAVADICHQTNPQPVTAKDFERLFAEAM